jgi:hypothetical protein
MGSGEYREGEDCSDHGELSVWCWELGVRGGDDGEPVGHTISDEERIGARRLGGLTPSLGWGNAGLKFGNLKRARTTTI